MAKRESTFLNMVLTLFLVTLLSASAVGFVYEWTKGPKATADLAKKITALKKVLPEFDNNPLEDKTVIPVDGGDLTFYRATLAGAPVGTAAETFSNRGFGDKIVLMVGFLTDGRIYDVAVVEHKETPGLGDKMQRSKSDFSVQFKGKDPAVFDLQVSKDGGDVDAITAATVSSRAFCDAVKRAYDQYQKDGRS